MQARQSEYGAVPVAGGFKRPTFWTKRRRTAVSLFTVIALIAGLAVAFKLFDRAVPNNTVRDAATFDFEILKRDSLIGETEYQPATAANAIFKNPNGSCTSETTTHPDGSVEVVSKCPGDMYPGDTREVDVRLRNTNLDPERDASFEVYIENVDVFAGKNWDTRTLVSDDNPSWNRFVNSFILAVQRQDILYADGRDVMPTGEFSEACEAGVRELVRGAPCNLGLIRSVGSTYIDGSPSDQRDYVFQMSEIDDGSDQSQFKGWYINVTFVFVARLPAVMPSGPAGVR